MTDEKKLTVTFAPGAFDQFDGTQEELESLIADITNMFANKSSEELKAMSIPVDELDDEDLEVIAQRQIRTLQ